MIAGKQGNLKSWLASASVSQPLATAQQATAACSVSVPAAAEPDSGAGCLKGLPKEASVSASVLGKRASAKIGNPKQKAAKQRGIAGQSSLKAFMRPQAVPQAEQTVPSGSISQVGGFTAEASLSSQVLTEPQQSQSQARSQPTSLEANQVLQRQDVFGTGMHESADLGGKGSHIRQLACSASSQPAVLREPQGSIERQGSDRASAENSVPMQSKRSCASSEADVDELIDAASRWDEVKGTSRTHLLPLHTLHVMEHLHGVCPRAVSGTIFWQDRLLILIARLEVYLCNNVLRPGCVCRQGRGAGSHILAASCGAGCAPAECVCKGSMEADPAEDEAAFVQGPLRALRHPPGQEGRPQSRWDIVHGPVIILSCRFFKESATARIRLCLRDLSTRLLTVCH